MKTGKSMRRKELKLALLDYISVLKFSFWLFFFRGLGLVFVVGAIIFIVSLFTSCAPEPIEELDPAYYYTDSATIAQDSIMKILEAQ